MAVRQDRLGSLLSVLRQWEVAPSKPPLTFPRADTPWGNPGQA